MSSHDTMNLLGDAFISLLESIPLEKICVSDIVSLSGKNRKTFYYHFEGKEFLVYWVFRRDLSRILLNDIEVPLLVYEKEGERAIPYFPYYVFRKIGVRSLDGSVFLNALAHCFQFRRKYYAQALRMNGINSLTFLLRQLYIPAFEADIRFILSNRYLSESNIKFLAEFYAGALFTYFTEKINASSYSNLTEGIKPFENIIHSSLEDVIKTQQLNRVL